MQQQVGNRVVLLEIYQLLYDHYGPQHWWPGDSPFEVVLGAILTQAAAWTNVEKALANLKEADCFSLEALRDISEEHLASLLRSSGYFNAKAHKVKALINHVWEKYDGDLDIMLSKDMVELRQELLSIYGIGEETADDIIVFAAGKPSFVIDSYTRRVVSRLGQAPEVDSYRAYQEVFHRALPADPALFNEFHALLDQHAKATCKKTQPACESCCLNLLCPFPRTSTYY